MRFDQTSNRYLSFEEHMSMLMREKNGPKGGHTIWFVSNCHQTRGASARFAYAQEMIKAGLGWFLLY